MIIAGAIHDFEHFGFTNDFLVNTQHAWAIQYNDTAVLENHHVAGAMELTMDKKKNIFENMNRSEYFSLRKRIIKAVLTTDMSKHEEDLKLLKLMISDPSFT